MFASTALETAYPVEQAYLPAQLAREQHLRRILEQTVAPVFCITGSDLWALRRGSPNAAFARQVAMYLAHICCGLSLTDVGRLFVRDRTTVAHACGLIEDRREDKVFDRVLELLEGIVRLLTLPLP